MQIGIGLSLAAGRQTGDAIAPLPDITANESGIMAGAFTATITFSEDVTGFVVGGITAKQNGSAASIVSAFTAVSGKIYTAVVTPTVAGTITVEVAAGVCTDAANNANTASNVFSIVYGVFREWYELLDWATLFKNATRTTPVDGASQEVLGVADKSGNGRHLTATTGAAFTTKANVYGSVNGIHGTGGAQTLDSAVELSGGGAYTLIVCYKFDGAAGATTHMFAGNSSSINRIWRQNTNVQFAGGTNNNVTSLPADDNNVHIGVFQFDGTNVRVWFDGQKNLDGSAKWYSLSVTGYTPNINEVMQGRSSSGYGMTGDVTEWAMIAGAASDALLEIYLNAFNARHSQVFF